MHLYVDIVGVGSKLTRLHSCQLVTFCLTWLTQGFGYEVAGQNTQPSLVGPLQQASQQRPYFQAAGVNNAQRAADARTPSQQQVPLQQIPFFPQPMARGQPAAKPTLFVPAQPASRPVSASSVPVPTQHTPAPALSQAAPHGRQNPAVSSRLSALKARLDTEKQKAGGEPSKTVRCFLYPTDSSYPPYPLVTAVQNWLRRMQTDRTTSCSNVHCCGLALLLDTEALMMPRATAYMTLLSWC